MSTLAQTPDGDLDFASGGLVVERDPDQEVATRLTNRFRLVRGEWQYDARIGVPYFERVFFAETKATAADLPLIRSMIRGVLEDTPGVATVDTLDLTLSGRTLTVSMAVRSQTGALISGQLGAPFIVEL